MESILYIGITQSLFAGFILATRKPQRLSNRLLAIWLFLITFDMILALIAVNMNQIFLITSVPFAYGPILYFYTQSLINKNLKISKNNILHFLPFFTFFILSLYFRKLQIINTANFFEEDSYLIFRYLYSISFFASITTYSLLSYQKVLQYQQDLKDISAFFSRDITLNWLKVITVLFFAVYILMFIIGGIQILGQTDPFAPVIISYFGLTIFAFLISFYGISQPVLFGYIIESDEKEESKRYERSGLSDEDSEENLKRLLSYLKEKKPYLNSELTIHHLSSELNISRHHLTQVINGKLKKNFYTFINEFRLEEAKQRIADPKFKNFTLLAIAYDSGFNSKSTFNDFFKKMTGSTPSQYKKSLETAKN